MYACIVCEFHCGARRFQCSSWGLVGAAPISCSAYAIGDPVYTCIQKCMYSQIVCDCFWAIHFLFIILECNLLIIVLLFLLSSCCFTSLYLLGLCSNVSHHFLQGMMLVAASLNRALVDLYNLKEHYNQE